MDNSIFGSHVGGEEASSSLDEEEVIQVGMWVRFNGRIIPADGERVRDLNLKHLKGTKVVQAILEQKMDVPGGFEPFLEIYSTVTNQFSRQMPNSGSLPAAMSTPTSMQTFKALCSNLCCPPRHLLCRPSRPFSSDHLGSLQVLFHESPGVNILARRFSLYPWNETLAKEICCQPRFLARLDADVFASSVSLQRLEAR
jgi:hypothetical protein